jgi:hypothetical protein
MTVTAEMLVTKGGVLRNAAVARANNAIVLVDPAQVRVSPTAAPPVTG